MKVVCLKSLVAAPCYFKEESMNKESTNYINKNSVLLSKVLWNQYLTKYLLQEPALLHPPEGVPDVLPAEVHQGKGSGPRGAFIQQRHSAYRFKVNKKSLFKNPTV